MLQHYSKGDTVKIEHKPTGEGRSMYVVSPTEEKPTSKPASNDIAIKWGMAFNNATRLVTNIKTTDSVSFIEDKVKMIEEIMPDMFRIACNMPDKVQKKDDDDLPF